MTIAVFGADGQLGQDLLEVLSPHRLTPLDLPETDITDRASVTKVIRTSNPDWVINAAAMTHVDRCEDDNEQAFLVNAIGARHVAEASQDHGAALVHISTDYVFDGRKKTPYVEDDDTNPINAYGISKLAGELYVRYLHERHYVVRTSGLYGVHPCRGKGGRNFVDTMLALAADRDELKVVSDEVLTPTFAHDLAQQIARMIETEPTPGVYHATNAGECSWFDFTKEIFKLAGKDIKISETTSAAWGAPARRPAYSVLDNAALREAGIDVMPDWRDALERFLELSSKGA